MAEPRGPNEQRIRRWGKSLKYVVFILGVILLAQTVADVAATRFPVSDFLFTHKIDATGSAGHAFTYAIPGPDRPVIILRNDDPAPKAVTPAPAPNKEDAVPTESPAPDKKSETPAPSPQASEAPEVETDSVFVFRHGPGSFGFAGAPAELNIECEGTVSSESAPSPDSKEQPKPDATPSAPNVDEKIVKNCFRFRVPDVNGAVPMPPMAHGLFNQAVRHVEPLPLSPIVAQNGLIAASLVQFLIGVAALAALYQLCKHYEAGQIFSPDNARLYRRLGIWLIAFAAIAIVVPVVRWLSVYAGAPFPPPFDWRFLAVDLWLSPYLIFAVVGIFLLLLGRVMAETATLAEDAKLTI